MSFERLTPDLSNYITKARKAAEEIAGMSNRLSSLVAEIETNLRIIEQQGGKAEKLDYCVHRNEEIRFALNTIELGSFFGIAVKNTCEELWQNLP